MFPPFIVCHSFYHSCQVPCYCQRSLIRGLYENINHVLDCYCENLVWICYKCSPVLLQTVSCNVLFVQLQPRTGTGHSWPRHTTGVTTAKYISTLKGMLYLLKEGTSFFDTPGSSSKWVDRPVPSLCRAPLPVPTITGPRFCISSSATLTSTHSADCCIHQNHCLWKIVFQFKYCHTSFVYQR